MNFVCDFFSKAEAMDFVNYIEGYKDTELHLQNRGMIFNEDDETYRTYLHCFSEQYVDMIKEICKRFMIPEISVILFEEEDTVRMWIANKNLDDLVLQILPLDK